MNIAHNTRPAAAPAYYLGRTAEVWLAAFGVRNR